jgi:hypothetical protein
MADQGRTEEERVDRNSEEAEMMARLQEEISNLPVGEHLVYMMHSLSALAVGRLGLAADTAARRDLGEARLAIDAFKTLLGVLEQVRPAGELAVHRGMLSQLQLGYAGATERGSAAEKPEATAEKPEATAEKTGSSAKKTGGSTGKAKTRQKAKKPGGSSQGGS